RISHESTTMTDHLEGTRKAYYTLIITVLSIAAFCMTPQESQRYYTAKQELELLQKINVGAYRTYLKSKLLTFNYGYTYSLRQALALPPYSLSLHANVKYRGVFFIRNLEGGQKLSSV